MITEYNSNLKRIFNHYGQKNQQDKLIEECAELIKAISKKNTDGFIEELADVQCLIDQFTLTSPQLFSYITEIKHKKADREVQRIEQNEH